MIKLRPHKTSLSAYIKPAINIILFFAFRVLVVRSGRLSNLQNLLGE